MPRYTIDRFEDDDWAVLEDEETRTFRIPRPWLPAAAREGDVLKMTEEPTETTVRLVRLELDPQARDERRGQAERRRNQLPRGPKGDISL